MSRITGKQIRDGTVTGADIEDDTLTGADINENTLVIKEIKDADDNTKIQVEESADENKIRFDTAGLERMIIDETGKVGIGTTSPGATLVASGSVSGNYIAEILNGHGNSGHGLKIASYGNGSGTYLLDVESRDGEQAFIINADGNVGIGDIAKNSIPAALSVKQYSNSPIVNVKDSSDNVIFKIGGQAKVQMADYIYHATGNDLDTYIGFSGPNQINLVTNDYSVLKYDGKIKINLDQRDRDTQIFGESPAGVILHVDAEDARVGIGTTTPGSPLHVDGGNDAVRATANSGHLILGPTNGTNLVLDGNEIIARNNGQPNVLYLNHESAGVHIGDYNGVTMGSEVLRVSGDTIVSGSLTVNLGGSGEVVKIAGELDENVSLVFEQPMGTNRASIGLDGGDNMDIANYSAWDDINIMTTSGAGTLTGLVVTAQQRVGVGHFGWEGKGPIGNPASGFGYSAPFPSCALDVSGSFKVSDNAEFKGGVYYNVRDVNSTSTVRDDDYVLRCIQNSDITITLPAKNSSVGRVLIFKDALGNAGPNPSDHNITLDGDSNDQIDGSATYIIDNPKESVTLTCDGINGWMITSKFTG